MKDEAYIKWWENQMKMFNQLENMTTAEAEKIGKAYSFEHLCELAIAASDMLTELRSKVGVARMQAGYFAESVAEEEEARQLEAQYLQEGRKLHAVYVIIKRYRDLKRPADRFMQTDIAGNPVICHTTWRTYHSRRGN